MTRPTLVCLMTLGAAPAFAQAPPPAKVDIALSIRNAYSEIKTYLLKSAEKVDDYGYRPAGIMPEVRTWGQLIGHIADDSYWFCARAKGEENPLGGTSIEKTKTARADLIKALHDAFAYCDTVYSSLTEAQALEYVTLTLGNNTTRQVVRASPLWNNIAHDNGHYGNLVTYMRTKGIVPPSSESR